MECFEFSNVKSSFVACLPKPFNKSGEVAEPRISKITICLACSLEECEDIDLSQYRDAIYRLGVSDDATYRLGVSDDATYRLGVSDDGQV